MEIPEVPGALRNVNSSWAITWLAGVIIYCTSISIGTIQLHLASFTRQNTFEKKELAWGNAMNKLLNLN